MLNRTWWSPFPYQNEKVMWLFIHKCFDFILIWARSFLKQLQHNINDNIVFQAFINTTTLLKCPDFPSIYNRFTTICLKTLDISIYWYIAINIAILCPRLCSVQLKIKLPSKTLILDLQNPEFWQFLGNRDLNLIII